MKRLIACSLGLAAAMAFAFPTPSQFSAAQNDVNELMRTLRADYRAKRKTAVEVADAAEADARTRRVRDDAIAQPTNQKTNERNRQ